MTFKKSHIHMSKIDEVGNYIRWQFYEQRIFSQHGFLSSFYNCTCKGHWISEWLFGAFNFPKKETKKFDEFLPKNLKSGQIKKIKALL